MKLLYSTLMYYNIIKINLTIILNYQYLLHKYQLLGPKITK